MTLHVHNFTIVNRDGTRMFEPLALSIKPGEVLTLMGPSGCGKSTLLSALAGHLNPDFSARGEISLNGQSLCTLPAHQREIGILFQDDLLFPHLSVLENLAFALPDELKGRARTEQAEMALAGIQLSHLATAMPDQISGGQRARVALVRMLLAKPKAVLLDEPFSKLDQELRQQFRNRVFHQLRQAGIPVLMVTHDEDDIPCGSQLMRWPWKACETREENHV